MNFPPNRSAAERRFSGCILLGIEYSCFAQRYAVALEELLKWHAAGFCTATIRGYALLAEIATHLRRASAGALSHGEGQDTSGATTGARAVSTASKSSEEPKEATRDPFEIAAYWHSLFEDREPEIHERERFTAWACNQDARNKAAYHAVERLWAGIGERERRDERILMRREAPRAPYSESFRWIR